MRVSKDKKASISLRTWGMGVIAWLLLLLGTPIVRIAFIGCIGAVFYLISLVLAVWFVIRVLRETEHSSSPYRAVGLLLLLAGMVLVVMSAWIPVELFEVDLRRQAEIRFTLSGPESPAPDMILAVFWDAHARLGLGALWAGGSLLFSSGIRLLGERSRGWLLAGYLAAGATGPLLLATCTGLLFQGWRSGN